MTVPIRIERADGAIRPSESPSAGPRPRAGSTAVRAVDLFRAATRDTSPRRDLPLQRRQLHRAEELHLVFELHAEPVVHAAA